MRTSAWLFWGLAAFFFFQAVGYAGWTFISYGDIEWTGTVALTLCCIFGILVAFYLTAVSRHKGRLPEDRPDATIDDGWTEMGSFSPWSWWPFVVASACFLIFMGFAIGIWMVMIGASLGVVAIVGWVYEYYRGYHAR